MRINKKIRNFFNYEKFLININYGVMGIVDIIIHYLHLFSSFIFSQYFLQDTKFHSFHNRENIFGR